MIPVSLRYYPWWHLYQDGWAKPKLFCKLNFLTVPSASLQMAKLSKEEMLYLVNIQQSWLEQHTLTRGSTKRPKMNLKGTKWPLTNKKTQTNKREKIDKVKMVCSGKSIGCKSAAFSPVALHLALTPKLNRIIPASQRQLFTPTPTSSSSSQHLFIYWNVYFSLKCPQSCHYMKMPFLQPPMATTLA